MCNNNVPAITTNILFVKNKKHLSHDEVTILLLLSKK